MTERKKKYKGTVLLCDGNNMVCRGGFATPPLSDINGNPTNAIKGFMNILIADIYKVKPTHVVVAWDKGGAVNWRKKLYPEYKGNRAKGSEMPQAMVDILSQTRPLRKLLKTIGIRTSCRAGVEADDIIGTLATTFSQDNYKVIINSRDKDFGQLVTDNVKMMIAVGTDKRAFLDEEGIKEKFGVWPEQIQDYLVLQGDGVDNIPGVYKCGPATAAKLLTAHVDLKGVIANKALMTPALLKNFNEAQPMFKLTKKLVVIKTDIPLKTSEENCKVPIDIFDEERFSRLCHKLNLKQTEAQIRRLIEGK